MCFICATGDRERVIRYKLSMDDSARTAAIDSLVAIVRGDADAAGIAARRSAHAARGSLHFTETLIKTARPSVIIFAAGFPFGRP